MSKQLKVVREAIKQQKWDEAVQQAQDIIDNDSKSYQAYVFLAFALDKKNKLTDAEKAYETATTLRPADPQAWQGLIKLYEKQGDTKLLQYKQAAPKLAAIFHEQEDMYKCQDVVDKFVDFARSQGSRTQYADALEVMLPGSPIYSALEGRFPHPAKTYEIVAQILETDEKKRINTLIGERRTRIGAKVSEVTVEVNREVLSQSKLGHIYEQLINWTNDDDIRRQYEEKLLQFRYDRLMNFLPGPEKQAELAVVQKLAADMVIIKHPYRLAWDVAINWQDHEEVKDYNVDTLLDYCSLFPETDLCKILTGYMTSSISPFSKKPSASSPPAETPAGGQAEDESSEDDEDGGAPTLVIPFTDEDRLLMMIDGISTSDSLLAHRLMGEYYQHLEEYESNVELMRKAMKLLGQRAQKIGKTFNHTNQAFMLYLGTALVFYQSPRHHGEAKSLFDKILEVNPSSTPAQIGVGLIYEEEEEYDQAINFLEKALERDSSNLRVKAEVAWLYSMKGDFTRGKSDLEEILGLMTGKGSSTSKELLAQTQHRLGVCIWNLDTSKAARKSRDGAYACFLAALKSDISYAPAYTSLGVYYADYGRDKKRARKCFLKAVELSSAEIASAERLARSFADDGDWDRVELVAQRVIDSGKVRPPPGSKRKGVSWPFSALGVALLNKQDYHRSVTSFQSALRMAPNNCHSWVGLGEAYHNAGRHTAAKKAILNAQRLEAALGEEALGDTWFTKYLLGNIERETGEYDNAILLYREVTKDRQDEAGVMLALLQTMVESAHDGVENGYFGKSISLATETIEFAQSSSDAVSGTFNFWKALGDACSVFSKVQSCIEQFPVEAIKTLLGHGDDHEAAYSIMQDVDGISKDLEFADGLSTPNDKLGVELTRCLHAMVLAHKRAVHLSSHDVHAQSIAFYNLGWAEYRAHSCLPAELRIKFSKYHMAAVRCFKRAIELEAGNPDFWNSLGVVTSEINPSVAQHSFVRALYLDERGVHVWANFGALALLQNDLQLANEAFTRAQSTDPDYAHAWLGQGFVALLYGDVKEARSLFTHAMNIAECSSAVTRKQFGVSIFDHILKSPNGPKLNDLIQPLFGLRQLQRLQPQDMVYGHLSTLFLERVGDHPRSIGALEDICGKLEAHYEETESPQVLGQFALAKTDLARMYLASGKNEEAAECGETALQLSSDDSGNELTAEQRTRARLSAHLTVGLAKYFNKNPNEALTYLEAALEESNNNPDVICLLAQVLWAIGTEEARDRAREVLFSVIESDSTHVQSVLLLGVVALLDEDEESMDAVMSELQALRASDKPVESEQAKIGEVLGATSFLSSSSSKDTDVQDEDMVSQSQVNTFLYPNLPHGWTSLSELGGEDHAAEVALQVASLKIPPSGPLDTREFARAFAGTGVAADAQMAAFMAPSLGSGWSSLKQATTATAKAA
ncbi:antiviral protein [Apiospora rasikravindrae]|uniref:Antiviral protein n=1 Tax=Apiospora rasikravindrae TaxID=990691 RepID=A0ABR1RZH7_9PEZI